VVALPHRGVNLSGGEFGTAIPGTEGIDYRWPTPAMVDYYIARGANTFRVGFEWERIQAAAGGELAAPYLAGLTALVTYATQHGATVIIEPHNFARYYGNTVGSAAVPNSVFADLWRRMALAFGNNASVAFNLMNEPHDLPTEQWVGAANAAIAAIRAAGAPNWLYVPGNGWTGAYSWAQTGNYGTPNAVAMLGIQDSLNRVIFEVHQYLDPNSGGITDECVSPTIGSERLAPFIAWLRANNKKGFVGEFAAVNTPACVASLQDMLATMHAASDVLDGWAWWGGGQWPADYHFSLEPVNGVEKPMMTFLTPYLTAR
jgi:endoglucanase